MVNFRKDPGQPEDQRAKKDAAGVEDNALNGAEGAESRGSVPNE
jgi:hypothetical protein